LDSSRAGTAGQGKALRDAEITQVAIVVRDAEETAKAWAEVLGIEPPRPVLTEPEDRSHTRYMGRPTPARAKLAFIKLGRVTLELIEPVGGPSTWQEFLDRHGEGVHHIAFDVSDMEGRLASLESTGARTVQRGDFTGGRYAYVDARGTLKVILELLESTRG